MVGAIEKQWWHKYKIYNCKCGFVYFYLFFCFQGMSPGYYYINLKITFNYLESQIILYMGFYGSWRYILVLVSCFIIKKYVHQL